MFGRPTIGATGTIDLAALDGTDGFAILGTETEGYAGHSVASAGDVNGDGLADIVIGALGMDSPGGIDAGSAFVILGAEGLGTSGSIDLSALNGTNGFRLDGLAAGDWCGLAVSGAGDINGDGFADIVIGAPAADPLGRLGSGETFVVFGGPSVGASGSVDLGSLSGVDGFVVTGIDSGDLSGISVSAAGDVNADGFDDLIIGAYGAQPFTGPSKAGESYLIFGGPGVGSTGSIAVGVLDSSTGIILNGVHQYDGSARSVSTAGDVNGDGFADVIVGAPRADPLARSSAGEAYVVYGPPRSPACVGDVDGDGFTRPADFNILAGNFGAAVTPNTSGDLTGDGLVNISDFNILAGDFGCGG